MPDPADLSTQTPFRKAFDNARTPYDARFALGITFDVTKITGLLFRTVAVQNFIANGTYTPTPGMLFCILECVGGGGGGGGVANTAGATSNEGSGGGGGGYSRKLATAATIGASQTVTIGAGGAGGAAGTNNGVDGGDTSVGSLCIAKGGKKGLGQNVVNVTAGGAGGVAGTGDFAIPGQPGHDTYFIAAFESAHGAGGNSLFGLGGLEAATVTTRAGNPGIGYGGGGGGGFSWNGNGAAAGAAGTSGIALITELIGT